MPALLLEWRETPDGWQGRVVRPVLDVEDGTWRPRQEWLRITTLGMASPIWASDAFPIAP